MNSYLRAVSNADFVIWLVGRETPPAVVDEIQTCISVEGKGCWPLCCLQNPR